MPKKIEEEILNQERKFNNYSNKIKNIEIKTEKKHSLPVILEETGIMDATRENLVRQIEQLNQNYTEFENELEELEDTRGRFYNKAIGKITKYLKGQKMEALRRKAIETPDPKDDGIINSLDEVNEKLESEKEILGPLLEKQKSLAKKLKGLRSIEKEFSDNNYTSSRSRFDSGFNLNALIIAYLAGRMSVSDMKRKINNNQHFKPRETYTSYSSRSSSSGSSFSTGGGFGGGGFSTGGGFGGGRFSTGGGF
jgi:hypothetical protein